MIYCVDTVLYDLMENNFDIITEQSYYLLSVDSLYYHYEALSSDEKLMKQLQGNWDLLDWRSGYDYDKKLMDKLYSRRNVLNKTELEIKNDSFVFNRVTLKQGKVIAENETMILLIYKISIPSKKEKLLFYSKTRLIKYDIVNLTDSTLVLRMRGAMAMGGDGSASIGEIEYWWSSLYFAKIKKYKPFENIDEFDRVLYDRKEMKEGN